MMFYRQIKSVVLAFALLSIMVPFINCSNQGLQGITSSSLASQGQSGLTAPVAVPVAAPVIQSLTSTQTRVSWVLSGGAITSLTLNGNDVLNKSFLDVAPAVTTTYVLVATNSAGFMSASTTITVASPTPTPSPSPTVTPSPSPSPSPSPVVTKPTITAMSSNPSVITLGSSKSSSTISWTVNGTAPITLKLDGNTVTGNSASVSPTATKSYTLTASNSAGSASASVTITVNPKPKVTASNPPTNGTTSTVVNWSINTTDTSFTVYCRFDMSQAGGQAYDPIVCPTTGVPLGQSSPLGAGNYELDFYIDGGQGVSSASTPDTKYNWIVASVTPTPTPSPSPSSSPSGNAPILMVSVSPERSFSSMRGSGVQLLGGGQDLSNVPESGINGTGTIIDPTGRPSTLRFGKITDPLNPSRKAFYMAGKDSDQPTQHHAGRVEISLDTVAGAMQKSGVTYWISNEMYIPAVRFNEAGPGTLMQIHNFTADSIVFGPFQIGFQNGVFPRPGVTVITAWSTQSIFGQPGYNDNEFYPWASNNPGFVSSATYGITQTYGNYPVDKWVKYVCKYRGDPTGNTGFLQVWMTVDGVTTQIVNINGKQLGTVPQEPWIQPDDTDYAKSGLDDETTGGGPDGVWELRRFFGLYKDNGNTEPQIRALME